MGTSGTEGDELTDTVKNNRVTPFRMAQIMKTAADITDRLVSGKFLYGANFQECEIVVGLMSEAIKRCKEEQTDVSEQNEIQESDEGDL